MLWLCQASVAVKEGIRFSVDLSCRCPGDSLKKTLAVAWDSRRLDSFMRTLIWIIFIRHGEPDYSLLEEAGHTGFGLGGSLVGCWSSDGDRRQLLISAGTGGNSVDFIFCDASFGDGFLFDSGQKLLCGAFAAWMAGMRSGIRKVERARGVVFEKRGCLLASLSVWNGWADGRFSVP